MTNSQPLKAFYYVKGNVLHGNCQLPKDDTVTMEALADMILAFVRKVGKPRHEVMNDLNTLMRVIEQNGKQSN